MNISKFKHLGDPIPIPAGAKNPPPIGTTGRDATETVPWKAVQQHVDAGGNWGMRVGERFLVLDVDAHASNAAADAATVMLEDVLKLPPTLHVNSRDAEHPLSGHYWYQIPEVPADRELVALPPDQGTRWADVRHRQLSYVLMPGSVVAGRKYRAYWRGGKGVVAHLPDDVFALFHRPISVTVEPAADGKFTLAQLDSMRAQARQSIFEFRFAREGSRDNLHYRACRDVGALARMGETDSAVQAFISEIRECGRLNRADSSTMNKTDAHIKKGYEDPRLHQAAPSESDERIWYSRPSLTQVRNRALLNLRNPWSQLLTELSVLAACTDHRITLKSATRGTTPAPLCLWLGLIGDPGSGKSALFTEVQTEWIPNLPPIAYPPEPLGTRYGKESAVYAHNEDTDIEARKADPWIGAPATQAGFTKAFFLPMQTSGKRAGTELVLAKNRVLCYYDEPETLIRKVAAENNLLSALKTSFFSGGLKHAIGKVEEFYTLHPRTYSASVIVGIQPERLGFFRDKIATGEYQRFLFTNMKFELDASDALIADQAAGVKFDTAYPEVRSWNIRKRDIKKRQNDIKNPTDRPRNDARRYVTLSDEAQYELDLLYRYSLGARQEQEFFDTWDPVLTSRSRADQDVHLQNLSHLAVKIERLAALLMRHDGQPLQGETTVVPYEYFATAKEIARESIRTTFVYQDLQNQRLREAREAALDQEVKQHVRKAREAHAAVSSQQYTHERFEAAAAKLREAVAEAMDAGADGLTGVEFNALCIRNLDRSNHRAVERNVMERAGVERWKVPNKNKTVYRFIQ